MVIKEVFPNPTVIKVIFQIQFPNLFSIESKMGDLQDQIISEFPESALAYRQPMLYTDIGPEGKIIKPPEELQNIEKIWKFKSPKNYELNVLSNSLDISSEHHKTYNNPDSDDTFRMIIETVLEPFLQLTKIPVINRIGLRYIDKCPIPEMNDEIFKNYYNTTFPLDRFKLVDSKEMIFRTVTKRGKYSLMYAEALRITDDEISLFLDFDGYAEKILSENYLEITDELHDIILKEYELTIKEPVLEYMKTPKEENANE